VARRCTTTSVPATLGPDCHILGKALFEIRHGDEERCLASASKLCRGGWIRLRAKHGAFGVLYSSTVGVGVGLTIKLCLGVKESQQTG